MDRRRGAGTARVRHRPDERFGRDRRSDDLIMRRSYLIAGAIALLAAAWLASGMMFKPSDSAKSTPPATGASEAEAAQLSEETAAKQPEAPAPAASADQPAAKPGEIVSVQVMTSRAEPDRK